MYIVISGDLLHDIALLAPHIGCHLVHIFFLLKFSFQEIYLYQFSDQLHFGMR